MLLTISLSLCLVPALEFDRKKSARSSAAYAAAREPFLSLLLGYIAKDGQTNMVQSGDMLVQFDQARLAPAQAVFAVL
jgi:hypothetical protein